MLDGLIIATSLAGQMRDHHGSIFSWSQCVGIQNIHCGRFLWSGVIVTLPSNNRVVKAHISTLWRPQKCHLLLYDSWPRMSRANLGKSGRLWIKKIIASYHKKIWKCVFRLLSELSDGNSVYSQLTDSVSLVLSRMLFSFNISVLGKHLP